MKLTVRGLPAHYLDEGEGRPLAVLDRAGHPVSTEQQTLFDALVGEWLDRVAKTIPSAR